MRIWPIPDPNALEPYPYDDNPNLGEFRDVWNGQMGHVSRTLATLLEGDKDFCGGQGLIDGICTATEGYCSYGMEGCWPDNLPYPILGEGHAGIADIWVMAHETGHVFGGWHTHCYDIDSCASEGSPGEPCYQATTHCRPGTIMSYCYACGGWGFMIMEYHPVVVADMRQTIDAAACMRIARDPVYVDRSNSGLEDGSQTNPYNTVLEGAETALPGGTVLIKPGTYPETFVLPYPCALSRDGSAGTVAVGQQ
jgi:hypothetical protein